MIGLGHNFYTLPGRGRWISESAEDSLVYRGSYKPAREGYIHTNPVSKTKPTPCSGSSWAGFWLRKC